MGEFLELLQSFVRDTLTFASSDSALRAYALVLGGSLFLASAWRATKEILWVRLVESRLRQGEDPKQDIPTAGTLGPLGNTVDQVNRQIRKLGASRWYRMLESGKRLASIVLFGIAIPTVMLVIGIIFYPWVAQDGCVFLSDNRCYPAFSLSMIWQFAIAQIFHASPADTLELLGTGPSAPHFNRHSILLTGAVLAHRAIVEASILAVLFFATRVWATMGLPTDAERARLDRLKGRKQQLAT